MLPSVLCYVVCYGFETEYNADLAPIGGEEDAPLLQPEPGIFLYAIGRYNFYTQPCTCVPEGEKGVDPSNLGINA